MEDIKERKKKVELWWIKDFWDLWGFLEIGLLV